jgi:hypothetical protein
MDRFVSQPIALSPGQAAGSFKRADVIFYGVDASGASFTARVFLDRPGSEPDFSPAREAGYAGFFTIFGHGGCFGDEGHCDVPEHRDPFDLGPPHPLTPQTKIVDVTERLRELGSDSIVLTALPISPSRRGPQLIDALQFTGLRLVSYQ